MVFSGSLKIMLAEGLRGGQVVAQSKGAVKRVLIILCTQLAGAQHPPRSRSFKHGHTSRRPHLATQQTSFRISE